MFGIGIGVLVILGIVIIGVFVIAGLFVGKGNSVSVTHTSAVSLSDNGDRVEVASRNTYVGPSVDRPSPENLALATALLAEKAAGNSGKRLSVDPDPFVIPAKMSPKEIRELLGEGRK